MNIRKANKKDFALLYKIGIETPEFKVSENGAFMQEDEFLAAMESPEGVFLVAEADDKIVGFIYANPQDPEKPLVLRWACLVYLVVVPQCRRQGVAQQLYDACMKELKDRGVTKVYGWASAEGDGSILNFMKKNGFDEGHKYIWMDKKI